MLQSFKKDPEHLQALDRVTEQTRLHFRLPDDAVILVTEIACSAPGCPPLETVVAFWTADAGRHQFKVFKPVQQMDAGDLPYVWMMNALVVPEGYSDDCC
jgi:hypothetical protein